MLCNKTENRDSEPGEIGHDESLQEWKQTRRRLFNQYNDRWTKG